MSSSATQLPDRSPATSPVRDAPAAQTHAEGVPHGGAERTTEDWVAAFTEGWRAPRGADGFLAHFSELVDDEIRLVQPQLAPVVGRRAFEQRFVRPLFELIPDLRADVERWAVNGDDAFIEITLRGSLRGRVVEWRACDRVTVRNGVAVERETYFDPTPLLRTIARTPSVWPGFVRLQIKARLRSSD
jgi:ketosteroid isomerase-like protein